MSRVGAKPHLKDRDGLCHRDLGAEVCPVEAGRGLSVPALNLKDDSRLSESGLPFLLHDLFTAHPCCTQPPVSLWKEMGSLGGLLSMSHKNALEKGLNYIQGNCLNLSL